MHSLRYAAFMVMRTGRNSQRRAAGFAGANTPAPPLRRLLCFLSCRNKKGRPPAGTSGSIVIKNNKSVLLQNNSTLFFVIS